ncbi:MAG: lysylphosphatidylglycerol synthase domain-containing protein [Thiotrichaceae bacterium]|nr:lysylphosphatidylglycerol synthase domain-containing protein [Thiotrichaceae bacterium]
MQRIKVVLTQILQFWRKFKYWFGYGLFISVIIYSLSNVPDELSQINLIWLLASVLVIVVMFMLQWWQVTIFLNYHNIKNVAIDTALFNARKGILNTLLPARLGTIALLHTITNKYGLKWHQFVTFMIVASVIAMLVSVLAAAWLLSSSTVFIVILSVFLVSLFFIEQKKWFPYSECLFELFIIAVCLYLATILVFFCLLRGLNYSLSFEEISYFAIVLNLLAQIAITPGNVGIREVVLGLLSTHVALPISVGIIASSLLFILRIIVYGLFWGWTEWYILKKRKIKK